jgi:hypothetical protein
MRKLVFTAFVVLLPLLAPVATAQSYAETVWTQLQAAYGSISDSGDYVLINHVIGKLSESSSSYWTFPLKAGEEYFVMAACDEDCSDVDLYVRIDGDIVASDATADDVPVVRFRAAKSGTHQIEVEMFECSNEPCFWGLSLFEK